MVVISVDGWQFLRRCRLSDDLTGVEQHTALFNDNDLGVFRRKGFVGLADIRSGAHFRGYNIDFNLLQRNERKP